MNARVDDDDFARLAPRTVELDCGPIRYREIGDGEPLVFVHGLLVNGLLWRKVVPALADRFRCIVPDWPLGGHVLPMQPTADLSPSGLAGIVAAFLTALRLEAVTVIANDTGGAVMQVLAARQPERFRRLVLTSCDMFDNFLPPLFRPLQRLAGVPGSLFVLSRLLRLRLVQRSPLAFGWVVKHGVPPDLAAAYLRGFDSSPAVRRDTAKVLQGISARYTLEAAEALRDFAPPVLLAWAREDRLFPVEHARRMQQLLPHARLELIDDSYAFIPEDQPQRLAALIADFAGAD